MRNFGMLINGKLQELKMPIRTGEEHIFTNDAEIIRAQGYKQIIYTEPETREEFYASGFAWVETETEIVQEWIYEEINYEQN